MSINNIAFGRVERFVFACSNPACRADIEQFGRRLKNNHAYVCRSCGHATYLGEEAIERSMAGAGAAGLRANKVARGAEAPPSPGPSRSPATPA
ncbi:hypothetical protein [Aquisalinus flavus]|uniref:Uncharacterized protein n=1 Tax=Aquisalinus flavus TaxID=1526572 RepID=A0A8J2Y577_9PROT|nr:hypothetical protein [Aquisalinus flavus]MBD0426247.1 hypothetical protein [Aquisalinus flavus]UNE48181.1 hypothetical protein FF099_09020 [Aquisalinus flavus]GGD09452.1 hypothetical protein GCM10011342_17900 [Aquisalinus flavus]